MMHTNAEDNSIRATTLGARFEAALVLMFQLHRYDVRKTTGAPYIGHLLNVCGLVLGDGGGEDEAIAALLHDALEDHSDAMTRQELQDRFGAHVVLLIDICTDTPITFRGGIKPPWKERKQAHIEKLAATDAGLLRTPLADKVDNVRALIATYREVGDAIWRKFNAGRDDQLWYYRNLADAFQHARGVGSLLDEYERLVTQLEALTYR